LSSQSILSRIICGLNPAFAHQGSQIHHIDDRALRQPVSRPFSITALSDQPRLLEDGQVMRGAGLGLVHCDHYLADAQLALPQKQKDLEATGISQGPEQLCLLLDLPVVQTGCQEPELVDLAASLLCVTNQPGHPLNGFLRNFGHIAHPFQQQEQLLPASRLFDCCRRQLSQILILPFSLWLTIKSDSEFLWHISHFAVIIIPHLLSHMRQLFHINLL
jgi:hypothetical protein